MSDIVEKLREQSINTLCRLVGETLSGTAPDDVETDGVLALSQQKNEILAAFEANMNEFFDELVGKSPPKEQQAIDFETLTIVDEDDMDAMVALEGMIAYTRNQHLANFISLNTRLNEIISGKRVDESSNPLDPHQVATSFQEAIRSHSADAKNSLSVYRAFNQGVLHHLDEVITEANSLLVDNGVLPNLGVDGASPYKAAARRAKRPPPDDFFGTIEEEAVEAPREDPEMFSMMQNLLHGGGTAGAAGPGQAAPQGQPQGGAPAGGMIPASGGMVPATGGGTAYGSPGSTLQPYIPAPGEQVQMVDQTQLMDILAGIQKSLERRDDRPPAATVEEAERIDIAESLGQQLQEGQEEGTIHTVDPQSSDVINLVSLLFEAIWDDDSVPIPIKELIGRTQITIVRVALTDQGFFNKEDHPARMLLNDFAAAGIGWTAVETLQEDPLYKKMQEMVNRTLDEYDGDNRLFEELISDFKNFQAREAAKSRRLEQRILKAKEREDRVEDIRELVTQKIAERILGRDLHPFVEELLEGPFHKYMVLLVLKEGPGGRAWKQAINTIDVLLWTVQPKEHRSDRARLDTVNPRLLNNLRKAFRIASLERVDVDQLIARLQEVQEQSFDADRQAASIPAGIDLDAGETGEQQAAESAGPIAVTEETLADDDPFLEAVDNFSVGIWVEFAGGDERSHVRCKLAAKINAIDKYIFVNRQGVKVVEKTRLGLAQELKDGTVRIISDGLLFSRALESVIGTLRETQHEQQTASAYHPDSQPSAG